MFKGKADKTEFLGASVDEVTVKLQWMTEKGEHRSEEVTFTAGEGEKTVETSFSAPAGMFLGSSGTPSGRRESSGPDRDS